MKDIIFFESLIKKILTITTITVLATFIMTIAMVDNVQALVIDESKFKCKSFGSFFDPTLTGDNIYTGSWADCSLIGEAGMASAVEVGGTIAVLGCAGVELASPVGLDSFIINKKGFISFSVSADQCFFDEAGDPVTAAGFCGPGGEGKAFTSVIMGEYLITDGLVDGKRVVGGEGSLISYVDHCAGDTAPYGNSGFSKLKGTIEIEDDKPPAPVLVSAVALDDESIKLTWTHDQTPAGGYDIKIDGVDTNETWRTTGLMQTITGLDANREYCFKIQARFTDLDKTIKSNELCATTTGESEGRGNPTAPVLVSAVALDDESIKLTWTPNASWRI